MNTKKLESNIKKFYLFQILEGMFFAVPVFVLFWQKNGLIMTEIMLLQSIFSIVVVFLEVPSGYFSDIFGRRMTLIVSAIFGALAMIIYSVGYNFWEFLVAELLFAIAVSFQSGTLSALVHESLVEMKREEEYKKIFGNGVFYGTLAIAVANILGGFIAGIELRYAVFASVPFFLMMIPVAFAFYEPKKKEKSQEKSQLKENLLVIKSEVLKNDKIKWLIIYSAVIYTFNNVALWIYQPYFKLSGLDVIYFGVVFASFQVVSAFSSKYAHKIEEKLGQKASLVGLTFLVSVSYLLMHNFIFLFSFSFAFIQQFVRGFRTVVISDYLNKMIKGDMRATILSVESLVGRLFYALLLPIIGWVVDIYSLENALLLIGILVLIFGITITLILKRIKMI